MAKLHGGEVVVRALVEQGVKQIFTLSGGHINPIYDACLDAGIRVIDVRHEQAAAMMADGWARTTGQPGVCVVTAGPGLTNAVTGQATAYLANSPLVLISGSGGVDERDRVCLQEMDQLSIMASISKWARVVYDAKRLFEYTAAAFRYAQTGRPGPVYLEIPVDVLYRECEEEVPFLGSFGPQARPGGEPEKICRAVDLFSQAARPLLVAGSGVWLSQAFEELKRFVELVKAPTFTIGMARGSLADDHPLCFGTASPLAPNASKAAFSGTDLLLALGVRLSYYSGFVKALNPKAKVIQVDIEEEEIGRNRKVELGIVGDARTVLAQLAEEVEGRGGVECPEAWVDQLRRAEAKAGQTVADQLHSDAAPIHPLRLIKEVDEFLEREAITVVDGGDNQVWTDIIKRVYCPGHYLKSGPMGCMGVGIPYAMAAALAHPGKRVLLLTGDGAAGINLMEFHTAVRHQIPFVMVVNNDQSWGMIKHMQELTYGSKRAVGVDLGLVSYDKVVEALGGYGELVARPEEISPALKRAFNSGLPACVNVLTDPEAISPGTYALLEPITGRSV